MRILLLCQGFNGLTQRLFVELEEQGHDVSVEFDINDAVSLEAVSLFRPHLVIAPFLKRAIPEAIWRTCPCLVVHPGPPGDRGASALDWAILDDRPSWGVTVLEARAEFDAGPVWAHASFPMRRATKSSLYRNEVTEAAVRCTLQAIERYREGAGPLTREEIGPTAKAGWRNPCRQKDRAIDWGQDDTGTVLRKIASADGTPGIRDRINELDVRLHDAHPAPNLAGRPGDIIATSGPAIARATRDGAVWIGRLVDLEGAYPFKLPATQVLGARLAGVPEIARDTAEGYSEIVYEEDGDVGILHFRFLNGAMGTEACCRLLSAYQQALARPTKVLMLAGGSESWSNGMDLNAIEATPSPADESWRNINAIDDLAETIIRTNDRLTVSALQGNAGAGGVFLARAADEVWLRDGVTLSPHYKDMGNLYGSEFWTYLLPRCVGAENTRRITDARLPMGHREALRISLANAHFGATPADFLTKAKTRAKALASSSGWAERLEIKARARAADECNKPLAAYRVSELRNMRANFYGFDPSYHVARYNFVRKVVKSRTPITIARHRDLKLSHFWRSAS